MRPFIVPLSLNVNFITFQLGGIMSQTVVITGVGSGLGAALVRKCVKEGCRVGMFARSGDYLTQLSKELQGQAGTALSVPTDLTNPQEIKRGFELVRQELGSVDILINHAGSGDVGRSTGYLQ